MEKYNKYILILIVAIVIGMSIGYSALNSDLKISGEVNYRAQDDTRITSFTTNSKPSQMTIEYSDFSKHEIKLGYTTTGACSITYTVEVKNSSGVSMGILSIGGLENNVVVQSDIIGKKLVGPAETKTFTITFGSTKEETKTYLLTFDFEQVFTITYNGFSNTENYKKEILEGEDYTQNFGSNAPTKLEITMGGAVIENYTYSNGTLTILNVNGNIEINAPNVCEFPSYTDSSEANAPILNGDMIPVVYSEKCKSWIKQDLDKSYDYSKQIWANAVTVNNERIFSDTIKDSSYYGNDGTLSNVDLENGVGTFGKDNCNDDNCDGSYVSANLDYGFVHEFSIGMRAKFENLKSDGTIFSLDGEYGDRLFLTKYENSFDFIAISSYGFMYINVSDIDLSDFITINIDYNYGILDFYVNGELDGTFNCFEDFDDEFYVESDILSLLIGGEQVNMEISDFYISNYSLDNFGCFHGNELEKDYIKQNSILYYDFSTVESMGIAREYYKNAPVGTPIKMDYINTMWVWIPRYSYTIKSGNGTDYYGKASFGNTNPTVELPGEIDIKFIKDKTETGIAQYMGDNVNGWRTNDAFNFGGENKSGIWVGKFETTGSLEKDDQACENTNCDVRNVTVKPGIKSLVNQTISSFYFMSRSMQLNNASTYGFNKDSGDLHMMKNDEWGAVAYLSQSKYGKYGNSDYTGANKEVYINNDWNFKTGHSGGSPAASRSTTNWYAYNDMTDLGTGQGQAGPGASTTGNITGIYDMSGGSSEYVMGVLEYDAQGVVDNEGKIATGYSDFNGLDEDGMATGGYDFPNEKYYNKYKSVSPTTYSFTNALTACNGGVCYGHTLSETSNWYSDLAGFVLRGYPWFTRGGDNNDIALAGVFYSSGSNGGFSDDSCRLAFTP